MVGLKEKVGTAIVSGGIALATLLSGGCEEGYINPNAAIGALGAGAMQNARTPEQARAGAMAYTYGTIAGSQPQVNVNVNSNQPSSHIVYENGHVINVLPDSGNRRGGTRCVTRYENGHVINYLYDAND